MLVRHAFDFAAAAHARQRRKDGQAFVAHLVRVARLLAERGYDDEVVAAALLHDVVEDTPVTLVQVELAFGPRVAALVAAVTEDPRLPAPERKREYRERVGRSAQAARAICAADKVSNLADLRALAAARDERVLAAFHGGLAAQVERFRAELSMLDAAGADPVLRDTMRSALTALRIVA